MNLAVAYVGIRGCCGTYNLKFPPAQVDVRYCTICEDHDRRGSPHERGGDSLRNQAGKAEDLSCSVNWFTLEL